MRALLTMQVPAYRWTLKRNCSASPGQLALVFGSIVALSFLIGIAFAAFGLWLVLPFVGLELLAVAAAFLCYGRHAADFERIELDGGEIHVERHEGGTVERKRLAALWARIEVDRERQGRLYVASHGARVEIGRHLTAERRQRLATELKQALRQTAAAQA